MQIICPTLIITYCLLLSSFIEAFRSTQVKKQEEIDLENSFYIVPGKFIPGKPADNVPEVTVDSVEKCTKHFVDRGFKVGIIFEDGKCRPVVTKKGDEILCNCGNHVGNYTLDSHTIETKKIKSKVESSGDELDGWLESGACDMIERTDFEYRCKKFEDHPEAVMLFKREN